MMRPPENIAIFTSGGIGDHIIALPVLELFKAAPQPVKIYTNYPEVFSLFIDWAEIIDNQKFRPTESCVVTINDFVDFKLKPKAVVPAFLEPMIEARKKLGPVWDLLIEREPACANDMAHLAVAKGLRRWTLPFFCIGREYQPFEWDSESSVHAPVEIPSGSYITIHDGFDKNYKFPTSTKSWPLDSWAMLCAMLRRTLPSVPIVQLGGEKHRQIHGTDFNYAGRLALRESLSVLKHSLIHIDGDSGLVHARRLFNKPSVVIFGPTNPKYFGYPENVNLAPSFCGDCWWQKRDWMQKCVKEFESALCMESVQPARVLDAVVKLVIKT